MWEVTIFDENEHQEPVGVRTFATQDEARWWAISWLKNGYVPRYEDFEQELFVPTARLTFVGIRDAVTQPDIPPL